jgi:phosphopentomutase
LAVRLLKIVSTAAPTRDSLADIGQTIAANFRLKLSAGESFLDRIYKM